MVDHPDMEEILTSHLALTSGMEAFYTTLVDLAYLREDEAQFPPHIDEGKMPLATAAI